jgi:hypothetical protein
MSIFSPQESIGRKTRGFQVLQPSPRSAVGGTSLSQRERESIALTRAVLPLSFWERGQGVRAEQLLFHENILSYIIN